MFEDGCFQVRCTLVAMVLLAIKSVGVAGWGSSDVWNWSSTRFDTPCSFLTTRDTT